MQTTFYGQMPRSICKVFLAKSLTDFTFWRLKTDETDTTVTGGRKMVACFRQRRGLRSLPLPVMSSQELATDIMTFFADIVYPIDDNICRWRGQSAASLGTQGSVCEDRGHRRGRAWDSLRLSESSLRGVWGWVCPGSWHNRGHSGGEKYREPGAGAGQTCATPADWMKQEWESDGMMW